MWYTIRKEDKLVAEKLTLAQANTGDFDIVGLPHLEEWQAVEWIDKHRSRSKAPVKTESKAPQPVSELVLCAVDDWEK